MKALSIWLFADVTFVIQSYVVSQTLCRIEPKNWDFMGYDIGYEVAKYDQDDDTSDSSIIDADREPVLLLNGFGVGSFHQHRLIPELLERNPSRIIYAMDYIGQGRSWPTECDDGNSNSEKDLIYSADLWVNQIISFLEQIVQSQSEHSNGRKVHLVGNSLGGHLAAVVASHRPDLVSSITLLNATPVWGLNLPGWSGRLPPPLIPRKLGRILFDWIRDLRTINTYLTTAYASSQAFDQVLIKKIRECTEGKGGHAAFASILWSPPATYPDSAKTFYDLLSLLQCDVLLLFGQEDPWCKPAFAKRMINSLNSRSISSCKACCRYLQLTNVGHCPNHEAPKAVGKVVSTWLRAANRRTATLVDGHDVEVFSEEWGDISLRELDADKIETNWVDRLAATFV